MTTPESDRPFTDRPSVSRRPSGLVGLRRGTDRFMWELHYRRSGETHVSLYKNGALLVTDTFPTRALALRWADRQRSVLERIDQS